MYAVETRALTKIYSPPAGLRRALMSSPLRAPITAVNSVDLQVEKGEIFGVLGPNGAGKTTLFKMLTTLLVPTSGDAIVAGHSVLNDEIGVRRSIGLVTGEERSFQWRMTGRQNMTFFAALAGVKGSDVEGRVDAVLSLMRLSDAADNMFYSYSSGMKQKMSIARALLGEPAVLFLDEPTKNVDAVTAADLKRFIRSDLSGSSGRTVIMATHRMEEAEELCDRIAILRQGSIVFCGTVAELRSSVGGHQQCAVGLRGLDLEQVAEIGARSNLRAMRVEQPSDDGPIELRFAMDEGDPDLSRALAAIVARGASVTSCNQNERRLEDLFMDLVQEETS